MSDKKFTTAHVIFVGLGSLIVGLVVGIDGPRIPGGTPVILVGDSVKLDAHDHILGLEFVDWKTENSGDGYWARGHSAITSISIQDPNGNEYVKPIDTTGVNISLTIKVALCGLSTTTIQVNQSNSDHIIHAIPPFPEKFAYDSGKKELEYKHMQTECPGGGAVLNKFLSVSGTAGGAPFGPVSCKDATGNIGYCQVLLKE